jgi:hypothetical protein
MCLEVMFPDLATVTETGRVGQPISMANRSLDGLSRALRPLQQDNLTVPGPF